MAGAYDRWAASYDADRNLTRDLDAAVTRALLASHRPAAVIEAGCGTGKNTAFLATIADDVLALDVSEGMLAVARARPDVARVRFQRHDLLAPWPVADAAADLVLFDLVLEHVESLAPLFAEAARVLRAGGTVHVAELHPYKQYLGSQARFVRDGAEERIPAHRHHVSEFVAAGTAAGLRVARLDEWWHAEDAPDGPPRLLTLHFERR